VARHAPQQQGAKALKCLTLEEVEAELERLPSYAELQAAATEAPDFIRSHEKRLDMQPKETERAIRILRTRLSDTREHVFALRALRNVLERERNGKL